MEKRKENDLQGRLFRFSVDTIKGVRNLPNSREYQVISYQLLKASTSVGANYEEAQAAVSKADFSNKVGISLKEIMETNYWIRIIIEISDENTNWISLESESKELMKILGSIYPKSSKIR
ncbi:four helix bundle protein [Ancylomarina sp.]|uniref:four helix bundle protein n=1 Tax=Ancylomarina sp. TaxID=1970196 RepID=UPI0035668575